MTKLDNLTDEQKQQEVAAFYERQRKMMNRGRAIIITIAVFIILGVVSNILFDFSLWTLIGAALNILFVVFLLNGFSWARYVLIAMFSFIAFGIFALILLSMPLSTQNVPGPAVMWSINGETGVITPEFYTDEPVSRREYYVVEPVSGGERGSFSAIYAYLSVVMVLYIVGAVVLHKSKGVEEYMYAKRYSDFD